MWKNEEEFVNSYLSSLEDKTNSTLLLRDFQTGYGLPDILCTEYSKAVVQNRVRHLRHKDIPPFTLDCAYTMAYLTRRRSVKISTLKTAFRTTNGSFDLLIQTLKLRRLVRIKSGIIKAERKKDIFAIKSITVLEAKLYDWKRAIFQAQRYRWFTDNCYVLLPKISDRQINRVIWLCKKYHVGLMMFSNNSVLNPMIKLKKKQPYNTYLAWLLNENLLNEGSKVE
jgi:hypothetical protein